MPESDYSDLDVARLYNVLNPWGASDDFYLDLVMNVADVLDVGCGTGTILKRALGFKHPGRLTGIDPDPAMLAIAREESGIEWVDGKAVDIPWEGAFDLAIMTGNAFQCLATDDDIAASLTAIHRALKPGGAVAFDTRNPADRAWEEWGEMAPMTVTDPAGRELAIDYTILDVTDGVVTLTENTATRDGFVLRRDRGELRFLEPDRLRQFLTGAGFTIEAQFGSWHREPFTNDSPFSVTLACRANG